MRRTLALSGVLAAVSLFVGVWLALGHGPFERDVRTAFDLEVSIGERTRTEHVVFVHDDVELATAKLERDRVLRHGFDSAAEWGLVANLMRDATSTLRASVTSSAPARHHALQERARTLLHAADGLVDEDRWVPPFSWDDPADVTRLATIVDVELVPRVERYRSPLGLSGALTLMGLVGGGALLFGLLVIGPLTVGVQIAQEAHENTLQPLTGTALTARSLVVGMSAGPLAVVALILAPQAGLFVVGATATGQVIAAGAALIIALTGCAVLTMLAALVGLSLGRKQSPGLVGTALLSILVALFFVGLAIGFELERETLGMVTIMPQVGAMHLLREALAPAASLLTEQMIEVDVRLLVSAMAFGILATITLSAVERRVAAESGPTLRRGEALVAAATLVVMSILAVPWARGFAEPHVLGSLALAVMPFMVLVMGRVPIGVAPRGDGSDLAIARRAWLGCLAEFGGFVALHLLVATIVAGGPWQLHGWSGLAGVFHLTWALGVAALVSIRAVAVPMRLTGALYLGFCLMMSVTAYVTAAVFVLDGPSSGPMFAFSHLSPVLGGIQAVLTIVIPWSLLRSPTVRGS